MTRLMRCDPHESTGNSTLMIATSSGRVTVRYANRRNVAKLSQRAVGGGWIDLAQFLASAYTRSRQRLECQLAWSCCRRATCGPPVERDGGRPPE